MIEKFEQQLQHLRSFDKYVIAYSGGLDSTVLLDLFAMLYREKTIAVHVNHGLSPNSTPWEASCQRVSNELDVELFIERVDAHPKKGESPEEAARAARYNALKPYIGENVCLLTAHNQNDQAETLLLQALRGAGTRGLAAMPSMTPFAEGVHARPLLTSSRRELRQYLEMRKLPWVEDESNFSMRFDRNYIRHYVMPVISDRWVNANSTLSRVAEHSAESQKLLDELAQIDLQNVSAQSDSALSIEGLMQLSDERQRNVLRYWIGLFGRKMPSTKLMHQIQQQMLCGGENSQPLLQWDQVELRCHQDQLILMTQLAPHDSTAKFIWNTDEVLVLPNNLGRLTKSILRYKKLPKQVSVQFRQGGELIKPASRQEHQSLKKLFQQWGVAPWLRDRIPLIYDGDQLIEVVGYCTIDPIDRHDQ